MRAYLWPPVALLKTQPPQLINALIGMVPDPEQQFFELLGK
jgi:hypothetical protein